MSSASSLPDPGGAAEVRQAWQDLLSAASQAGLYRLSDGQLDWPDILGRSPDARGRGSGHGHGRSRGQWLGPLFGDGWTFDTLQKLQAEYEGGRLASSSAAP